MDPSLRELVSFEFGYCSQEKWRTSFAGFPAIYVKDVRRIFEEGCLILLQAHRLAPPSFGAPPTDSSALVPAQEQSTQEVTRRQGRACRPVSIFASAPVCRESCVHCKACPCDVAEEHDDHTCYNCEQRMLNPAGDPNAPWRAPRLRACELICDHCSRQKCCRRCLHDIHACYWCDRNGLTLPTPPKMKTKIFCRWSTCAVRSWRASEFGD